MQRKNAAEERQRLEEAKAKVYYIYLPISHYLTFSGNRWEQEKLQGYAERQEGAKR